MSAVAKVPLATALEASVLLTQRLRAMPFVYRAEPVGSVRRREAMVGDLDFVYFGRLGPADVLARAGADVTQSGEDRAFGTWNDRATDRSWTVNLWRTTEASWGAAMFAWTGPQKYVVAYRMIAKRKGLKLNESGLYRGEQKIAGATEDEIVQALGKQLKAPELRGK